MIKSMTGFGHSVVDDGHVQINIEVKSLNSKFLDLNLRVPKAFSDKELDIRNLINEKLERGKVSVNIEFQYAAGQQIRQSYNEPLFVAYYAELKKLAGSVQASEEGLFELALNSPDVIQGNLLKERNEEDWLKVKKSLSEALDKCDKFRSDEGGVLEKMLAICITAIRKGLEDVIKLDPKRVLAIREKLKGNIVSFFGNEGYDANRLEQEIIFYIEKLDINEERVRLKSHLDYFEQALTESKSNGKKLGFISQEIGREINTIGSKANDAEIQKCVVLMKDELEKIKEQLNNVL